MVGGGGGGGGVCPLFLHRMAIGGEAGLSYWSYMVVAMPQR